MEPLSFLANLLLTVTIGTLMVALIAYMAYKLREKRKPQPAVPSARDESEGEMVFLRPYVLPSANPKQENRPDTLHRV